jgi:hypothetical protein
LFLPALQNNEYWNIELLGCHELKNVSVTQFLGRRCDDNSGDTLCGNIGDSISGSIRIQVLSDRFRHRA